MPLDITFTLSDQDLEHFQAIVDQARTTVQDDETAAQVEAAARDLLEQTRSKDLPEFIAGRMNRLGVVIEMINDEEWQLAADERRNVLSALAYFCDPEDLIPDHVPGLGFLDDAIYAEIVLGALHSEISLYEEFCNFRDAEETRRRARGDDVHVGREEWLADKRAALHAKMRKRRVAEGGRKAWRMKLW
jgi:uncharacterized membrane protein YkvA (DUF1232 family)